MRCGSSHLFTKNCKSGDVPGLPVKDPSGVPEILSIYCSSSPIGHHRTSDRPSIWLGFKSLETVLQATNCDDESTSYKHRVEFIFSCKRTTNLIKVSAKCQSWYNWADDFYRLWDDSDVGLRTIWSVIIPASMIGSISLRVEHQKLKIVSPLGRNHWLCKRFKCRLHTNILKSYASVFARHWQSERLLSGLEGISVPFTSFNYWWALYIWAHCTFYARCAVQRHCRVVIQYSAVRLQYSTCTALLSAQVSLHMKYTFHGWVMPFRADFPAPQDSCISDAAAVSTTGNFSEVRPVW